MSIIGAPFAGGWIIEYIDNSRKGYATPLPPWFDWSTRWIMGMFAWIIDFLFYVMPLMIAGVLFFCVAFSAVLSNSPGLAGQLFAVLGAILALYLTFVFLSSVSMVGRLIYVQDASPEQAMSMRRHARGVAPRRARCVLSRPPGVAARIPAGSRARCADVPGCQSFDHSRYVADCGAADLVDVERVDCMRISSSSRSMLLRNANSNGGDWLVSVSWCRKEKERWKSARRSAS
jgi:hypothetical protein